MADLSAYRRAAERAYRDYEHAARTAQAESRSLADARTAHETAVSAQTVAQTVAAAVQRTAHDRIASVVSRCLEAIFDDPYEFRIEFDRKRGRTEARLEFVRDDTPINPTEAAGGGVVDVACFALRTAALLLSRPAVRRLLVLDEPFRYVSRDYSPRVRDLVAALATDLGVQFIIVTHDPVLAGRNVDDQLGKVIRLD
jgi:hypothetical protein